MTEILLNAFWQSLTLSNLLAVIVGCTVGIVLGVLPGIGGILAIALFLGITFQFETTTALIMLGGLWSGAIYGGSISAILINTPGTSTSVATTFDGYPLARMGRGGMAVGTSLMSSLIGGIFGWILLVTAAPLIGNLAVKLGPAEYFLIALLALTVVSSVSLGKVREGLLMACVGLLLSFVGFDPITGHIRYNLGTMYLYDGIDYAAVVIGLFAISEALVLSTQKGSIATTGKIIGKVSEGFKIPFKYPVTLIRSSVIGGLVGACPGIGGDTANVLAYAEAVRTSKNPESFGKGNPEGVVAPEASNNATVASSLIPTLTLGIPGSAPAAVFMGALMMHGLFPGGDLFVRRVDITYTFFIGLLFAQLAFFLIGWFGAGFFAKITLVPNAYLVPVIIVLSLTGSFALRNNFGDVIVTLLFGFIGYILKKAQFPLVPLVLGLILGPMAERGLNTSLMLSGGSFAIFITRPACIVILFLIILSLALPLFQKTYHKKTEGDVHTC